jgi:hypothetical protein
MEQLTQFVSKSFEPGRCVNNRSGGMVEETSGNHSHPDWGQVATSGLPLSQSNKKPSPLSPCPDTTGSSSVGGEPPHSRGSSVSPIVDPDDSRSSPGSSGNPLLLNSPGTEPRSPEPTPEERPGVVNVGGNKTVLITREESKSGTCVLITRKESKSGTCVLITREESKSGTCVLITREESKSGTVGRSSV